MRILWHDVLLVCYAPCWSPVAMPLQIGNYAVFLCFLCLLTTPPLDLFVVVWLLRFLLRVFASRLLLALSTWAPGAHVLRASVFLARNCYNVVSIVANFLNPPIILNPSAWNLKGRGGFCLRWILLPVLCMDVFPLARTKGSQLWRDRRLI